MTARPRLVDVKICIDILENSPIQIEYQNQLLQINQGKYYFDLDESHIDSTLFFKFSGLKKHKQTCKVYYSINKKILPIFDCSCFKNTDDRSIKQNLNEIKNNGILTLNLKKTWWECNVFKGYILSKDKNGFIGWRYSYNGNLDRSRKKDLKNYEIVCVGASATWGINVDPKKTWPFFLQNKTKKTTGNFGVNGADHFTVLHNAEYLLEQVECRTLIIQLGPYNFSLPKRIKLRNYFLHTIPLSQITRETLEHYDTGLCKNYYNYFQSQKTKFKKIRKICEKKIDKLIKICQTKNINLKILYTNLYIQRYKNDQKNFVPVYIENLDVKNYQLFSNKLHKFL